MPHPVIHWELWSQDPQKCADFYAQAFGWSIKHLEEMGYHVVDTEDDDGINGGILQPQHGPWPGNMAFYISVEDLGEIKTRIVDAGGRILVDHQEVPNVGSFCLFEDPDGRVLGCWKQIDADDD